MIDPAALFIEATSPTIVERVDIAARPERRRQTPACFLTGQMRTWFEQMVGSPDSLWHHQALALEEIAAGRDVVIATGTGSGKSLVFQATAIRNLVEEDAATLAFYPQKSLGGDQLARWQEALARAGLDRSLVAEINGDIPMTQRDHALATARILLATPDAAHCWLMRQAGSPAAQQFFARLGLVIIDEAHAAEGVFGSNCAYFYRRLRCAVARARPDQASSFQYIAATATIADPADHLRKLTGMPFLVIDDE